MTLNIKNLLGIPGGAASLLLRSLQGRGKPQKEPGAHEEKA